MDISAVSWTDFLLTLGSALGVALAIVVVTHLLAQVLVRRWTPGGSLVRHARRPFRLFVVVGALAAVAGTVRPADVSTGWWDLVELGLRLALIGAGSWLVAAVLLFVEDLALGRWRTDVADNRTARRMRTQVLIIRRLTVAVVVVVGLGAALLSFPGVRAVGAGVLASAGLISVVAALAAQSTLANLFAGLQVAFSDAIRLDDVVIVEQEWGWIEEITLSYVVVRLWDDRRMVLPSTYFTSTPFQNWTRRNSELLGAVELDVDWRVDVDAMRAELDRVLTGTDLWDERAQVLQVTDAVGGLVRVRVLVSAVDAGTLFDLRCLVRERLVAWLQTQDEAGLPRQRMELVGQGTGRADDAGRAGPDGGERPGLFSGDAAGEERAERFRRGEPQDAAAAEGEPTGDEGP
jgi:small-conductance mechanosensitive channel